MKDRNKYINDFIAEKYDRINLQLPKGEKEKVKQKAEQLGYSMNEYIFNLIRADLKLKHEVDNELMTKLQIPKKYHGMIESCIYNDRYYITLKEGFINDVSGNRQIICGTTKEVRLIIPKSHPVQGESEKMTVQLQKWQIPIKYRSMIKSLSTNQGGHTIVLKDGYVNEWVNSNIIHVQKANEFRKIMKYTKEKE